MVGGQCKVQCHTDTDGIILFRFLKGNSYSTGDKKPFWCVTSWDCWNQTKWIEKWAEERHGASSFCVIPSHNPPMAFVNFLYVHWSNIHHLTLFSPQGYAHRMNHRQRRRLGVEVSATCYLISSSLTRHKAMAHRGIGQIYRSSCLLPILGLKRMNDVRYLGPSCMWMYIFSRLPTYLSERYVSNYMQVSWLSWRLSCKQFAFSAQNIEVLKLSKADTKI